MKVQPGERVGVYQCLTCLRVEQRATTRGHYRARWSTLRALKRRCTAVHCSCNPLYYADGNVITVDVGPGVRVEATP